MIKCLPIISSLLLAACAGGGSPGPSGPSGIDKPNNTQVPVEQARAPKESSPPSATEPTPAAAPAIAPGAPMVASKFTTTVAGDEYIFTNTSGGAGKINTSIASHSLSTVYKPVLVTFGGANIMLGSGVSMPLTEFSQPALQTLMNNPSNMDEFHLQAIKDFMHRSNATSTQISAAKITKDSVITKQITVDHDVQAAWAAGLTGSGRTVGVPFPGNGHFSSSVTAVAPSATVFVPAALSYPTITADISINVNTNTPPLVKPYGAIIVPPDNNGVAGWSNNFSSAISPKSINAAMLVVKTDQSVLGSPQNNTASAYQVPRTSSYIQALSSAAGYTAIVSSKFNIDSAYAVRILEDTSLTGQSGKILQLQRALAPLGKLQ